MNQEYLQTIYKNEADKQLTGILPVLIWASWASLSGRFHVRFYWDDWRLATITLLSSIFLIAPF